jgi:hypothetical protein
MFLTRFATGLALLAVTATVAACGGSSNDSGDSQTDRTDAALAYTSCMRDQGIDMPDPQADGNMVLKADSGIDPNSEEFKAAQEECGDIMDDAMSKGGPQDNEEVQDQMLDFAACMRGQGIDFPDPKVEDGKVLIGPGPSGEKVDKATMERATKACEDKMPEGLGRPGSPPSE